MLELDRLRLVSCWVMLTMTHDAHSGAHRPIMPNISGDNKPGKALLHPASSVTVSVFDQPNWV